MNYIVALYNMNGEEVGKITLDPEVFNGQVNVSCLHQARLMYEASLRRGTASTKTKAEVRGGGGKPWRQKGTGRARVGSIRSPLWRGGGTTFGPKPRDYYYRLPKKVLSGALKSILNARAKEGALKLIDVLKLELPKTKEFVRFLKNIKAGDKSLIVVDTLDNKLSLASRNINTSKVILSKEVNAYDILNCNQLILTKTALEDIVARIKKRK